MKNCSVQNTIKVITCKDTYEKVLWNSGPRTLPSINKLGPNKTRLDQVHSRKRVLASINEYVKQSPLATLLASIKMNKGEVPRLP